MPQPQRPIADACPHCPDAFDDHLVLPTTADPMDGGIVLCPHRGCDCFATWSPAGREVARIPSDEEVAVLRQQLQEVLGK